MLFFYRNLKIMEPTEKRKLEAMRPMYDKDKMYLYILFQNLFFFIFICGCHICWKEKVFWNFTMPLSQFECLEDLFLISSLCQIAHGKFYNPEYRRRVIMFHVLLPKNTTVPSISATTTCTTTTTATTAAVLLLLVY